MRVSRNILTIRLLAAIAAAWLSAAGPAWAGGGMDNGTLQTLLNDVCGVFPKITKCQQFPQGPTDPGNPIVLEVSALSNEPPDTIRLGDNACQLTTFGGTLPLCPQLAVNAVNAPLVSAGGSSDGESSGQSPVALSSLTPLAFKPGKSGPLATQYGDPKATSFFYAVVLEDKNGKPQALDLVFDYTPGTKKNFTKDQVVATVVLPLVVLSSGSSQSTVTATVQLTASCSGDTDCLKATVSWKGSPTYNAGQLGLQFTLNFGQSPNSASAHPIFELLVPPVVTKANDPAYFDPGLLAISCRYGSNPDSGYCNGFGKEAFGSPLSAGKSVGVGPSAAPYPHDGTVRPAIPFTASFFGSPSLAAYFAIDTTGKTLLAAQAF
jgi:hypothetical protein